MDSDIYLPQLTFFAIVGAVVLLIWIALLFMNFWYPPDKPTRLD